MSYKEIFSNDGFKQQTVAAGQNVKERDYWLKKLSGEITRSTFPYEYREPSGASGHKNPLTASLPIQLAGTIYSPLMKISNKSDVRLHILLLTGWLIMLHRYTSASDIVVGVPIYRQEVEGQLVNTALALRNTVNSGMTFKDLLLQVGQTILEANQNQNYPIDALAYKLNVPDAGGDFPLFDISILLDEIHDRHYLDHIRQNIIISFHKTSSSIEGTIEYNGQLYSESFMKRIITHYQQLLENALADVETPISRLEILPEQERQQLINEFNDNKLDFPREKTFARVFAEQVELTPDHVGLVGNVGLISLTYRQLNEQSDRLAGVLIEKGVLADSIVGIMMERSIEMVIGILGIWKAGGAYLPIDPEYPQDRVNYMLRDSGAGILLTDKEKEIMVNCQLLIVNCKLKNIRSLQASLHHSNLAYVIYTSGSTGKPKGAMVEHIGMMNHMWAKVRTLQITSASIVAQTASHTFDISVWQFFVALTQGGKTVIYPEAVIMDAVKLLELLVKDRVSVLELVPSYLSILLDVVESQVPPLALEYLLVTGEEIKPRLVNRWFGIYPGIKMVNAYGPTEASDDITQYELSSPIGQVEHVPIGKPLQNFDILIVNEHMQLCPLGIKGEIGVSGVGVGRGYLNRPELTADRFIKYRSYRSNKTYINYKTGDLGRWLPDGTIEFFGRKDYQVKIRGFRIELGEIENLLASYPGVKEAVVIDREEPGGEKYLCAYYVPGSGAMIETAELKTFLSSRLPDYMIPAHFVILRRMPLTANGKIDRAALPVPSTGEQKKMTYITVEMLQQVKVIAPPAARAPEKDLSNEPERVLSEEEKHQLLYEFNNTTVEFSWDKTIHQLYEDQAEKTPDAVALVGAGLRVSPGVFASLVSLTYHQLNKQSNRAARGLTEKGILVGDIIAVMMERTLEMMAVIFGIFKAGAAYMPIDLDFPRERVDYMLKDSNARILINKSENPCQGLSNFDIRAEALNSSNLAYIMYTSGSTGAPKGVMIRHRSVVNFFKGMLEHFQFDEKERILSLVTVSFDIFFLEGILPLTRGSRVVLGSEKEQVDFRAAAATLQREKITMFQSTPSAFNLFLANAELAGALKQLKYVLLGGEELLMPLLQKFRGIVAGKIFNLYGPTETTVWSTVKDVSGENDLNVGKPIANTQVYILAENGRLQPVGIAGELCIGGEGVAMGYLNRPELTSEKFGKYRSYRTNRTYINYKTGDMARWLPDGNIEFLGRKDNQIQLKGIRVELGEIECVLLKQEGVTEAAVVVRTDKEGEKYLRAALVSHQELTIDRLRERLAGELPHYMIPSEFFQLEKMPLTPSGKINRKVIEAIELPEPAAGRENTVYVAPGTPLEAQIADIWKEILNKSKVSIYDNFFDLGGNSLGVIQVNVKLKETLHRDIPALALFEYPTIDALARYLEPKPTPTDSVDEGGDEIETARTEIKSKGRDRMQQRKTKLKEGREERVNQIK